MASQHQPKTDSQGFTHHQKFTTFTAAIDLRAQSGYPSHCPQQLLLCNDTAGALDASITDLGGHTVVWSVPAYTRLYTPIGAYKTIEAATADTLSAIKAFWWVDGSTVINP